MASKDSIKNTFFVAISISLICSIFISSSFVLLKERQDANRKLDVRKNILQAAKLLGDTAMSPSEINAIYEAKISSFVVDFSTGERVSGLNADNYDQRKATKKLGASISLSQQQDIAGLKRRANLGVIYEVKENDEVALYIIPISGYGLWSTIYGFLALSPDAKVEAITFYEHGETPGLGGEIDNPKWKALFQGKTAFDASGEIKIRVIQGAALLNSKNDVDGLSGATFTSRGVNNMLKFWLGNMGYGRFLKKYLLSS